MRETTSDVILYRRVKCFKAILRGEGFDGRALWDEMIRRAVANEWDSNPLVPESLK